MDYFLSIVKRRRIRLRECSFAGFYNEAMPELPEVETIARGVDARVRGDQIVEAWFSGFKQPFKTSAKVQARRLEGSWILGVRRLGKTYCVLARLNVRWVERETRVLVEGKINPIGSGLFTWA